MIESQKDKLNTGAKKIEDFEQQPILTNEQIEQQQKIAKLINIWKNKIDPEAEANWTEFEKEINSGLAIDSEVKKP